MTLKKWILVFAIAIVVIGFIAAGGNELLTLENLKRHQQSLGDWIDSNLLIALSAFVVVYVLVTALSLPGATVMTLAGGAFFGNLYGFAAVSLASTVGASLAFLAARFLVRDSLRKRYGDTVAKMDRGIEKDGAFYLATLRLVPVFPFFLINLAMGLTAMKLRTYAVVSWVAMLPGTFVYVNAGTQLGQIQSTGDIVSVDLLLSFALLGLFPLIAKFVVGFIRRRKVYAGWQKPAHFDYNLLVIGGGSAGLVSAYIAAAVKAKVALIEKHKMGGDCLNTGCVPSKALIKSAKVAEQMRRADRYGLEPTEPKVPFNRTIERVMGAIRAIEPNDSVERYEGLGVDVVEGYAKIVDPWRVEITCKDGGVQRLTTRAIVIAAGADPVIPPIDGLEGSGFLTSDTMWDAFAQMDEPPARVVVLGGGPIGCELSQALARLGSQVTQIEMEDRVLGREDTEVSALAKASLEASGVRVLTGHRAARIGKGQLHASGTAPDHKNGDVTIPFDTLIVAVGRAARLRGYGLEQLGIDTERTVVTDDFLATKFPNIYAAGDVAGPFQLTHVASHQAWFASVNALFGQFKRFKADYRVIPAVTFLDPEVARVGINESEAKEQGIDYEVTRFDLDDLDRAIAESETKGFVKVLTPPGKDTILGATIVGAHAGELLAEYVLAMKHKLGLGKILGTIHSYPTMAEANKFAAGEWKKKHKPEGLLNLVEKYHAWRRG